MLKQILFKVSFFKMDEEFEDDEDEEFEDSENF